MTWLPHTGALTWKPSQGTKLYCLVNRGTLVWTTCPRLLPDNAAAAWELNSRSAHRESSALTTTPPSHPENTANNWDIFQHFISLRNWHDYGPGSLAKLSAGLSFLSYLPSLYFLQLTLSQHGIYHLVYSEQVVVWARPTGRAFSLSIPSVAILKRYPLWTWLNSEKKITLGKR